jgi:hypothetical protein
MHYLTMKSKGLALLLISGLTMLIAPAVSFADSPTPTPSATISNDYQLLLQQYRSAIKAREQARFEINRTFMLAVEAANRDARTAMKLAKNAATKNDAISKQKLAITAASDARDAAMAALGPIPIPPVKPSKMAEPSNKGKGAQPSPSSTR